MKVLIVISLCLFATIYLSSSRSTDIFPMFKDPPSSFRPSPFWSWNAALDDDELRWQIRQFKDQGYGGYFMHSRVGLVTRYLSDAWFQKIGLCLMEGRRLGLESWLYDEDKWPSGFAGGLATHEHPEFIAMGMGSRDIKISDLDSVLASPETLAVFEINKTAFRRISSIKDNPVGPTTQFFVQPYQKTNWYNGEVYLDTLNPEAVAHFLDVTFTNGYNRYFRRDYGPAMPGVFTDEPNFQAGRGRDRTIFPWTRRLPQIFREKHGYNLVEKLPLLSHSLPGFEQVRYDFWRTVAEQFESSYNKQYGEMADRLGLKLTGHYLAEDTLSSQTNVTGSVMLQYLHQQMPGIDHLRRNIADPQTLKQVSSVAHQFDRERVLCEIYGVSGHTATFEDLKWIADFHYGLGINFLCPHLTLYSMTGDRKRDYPPTFSYHQPYWPYMKLLNDYLARAAYFVTRGKSQKNILLLEPLGSAWAHTLPGGLKPERVTTLEQRFTNTLEALLSLHRDFDLGEEIILERSARIEGKELRIGPAGRYQVVVIPPAYRWNPSTARLLGAFLEKGGHVVFRGEQPAIFQPLVVHRNAHQIGEQTAELAGALDRVLRRDISIADDTGVEIGDIIYQHRYDGTRHFFFLSNTNREKSHRAIIKVKLDGLLEEWNLNSGDVRPLGNLNHEFPPAGSFAFAVNVSHRGPARATESSVNLTKSDITVANGPFTFKRLHPNTLVLDFCRYSLNQETMTGPVPVSRVREAALKAAGLGAYAGLQPWALEWKNIHPTKTVPVRMSFEFESELDRPRVSLVVEKMKDFEISCNGERVGPPTGWNWDKQFDRVDLGGRIRKGTNQIDLTTVYKVGTEIEDIFVIGDFATRKVSATKYVITAEPTELSVGDWVDQGYHFYSGNISYQIPFEHVNGERVCLRLKHPMGTAFIVRLGNQELARLGWPPWEADITSALRPGRNVVEVIVLSSLQNSFGPLHNDMYVKAGHNWWIGPGAFTDAQHWTDAYYHAPYGLGELEFVRSRNSKIASYLRADEFLDPH